jgi:hypothetical protein
MPAGLGLKIQIFYSPIKEYSTDGAPAPIPLYIECRIFITNEEKTENQCLWHYFLFLWQRFKFLCI